MPDAIASCAACGAKNRIPSGRNPNDAKCGHCRQSLISTAVVQPLQSWEARTVTILIVAIICSAAAYWVIGIRPLSRLLAALVIPASNPVTEMSPDKRPSSESAAKPAYWDALQRLEPLIDQNSPDPYPEHEFLWFISESHEWIKSTSYRPPSEYAGSMHIFRQQLSQRAMFPDFQELFELGAAAEAVTARIATETQRLEVDFQIAREQKAFSSAFKSGLDGGQLGAGSYLQGATGKEAVLVGGGYALISALVRFSQDQADLDVAQRRALEGLAARSKKQLDELAMSEEVIRQRLRSGISLEIDHGEVKGIVRRDVDQLLRVMDQGNAASGRAEQQQALVQLAAGLLELRLRVPIHPMYDRWRAECAYWAAHSLEMVALQEAEGKAWGSTPSRAAEVAVRLWDLAWKSDPDDAYGFIRAHRACSMALAGRVLEASRDTKAWISSRAGDSGFAALYLRLLVLAGDTGPDALLWLDRSIDARNPSTYFLWSALTPTEVRTDPCLTQLVLQQSGAVSELLRPKFEWRWVDGWLSSLLKIPPWRAPPADVSLL